MSSGSYFTIYRKHKNTHLTLENLNALKDEYYKSNNEFSSKDNTTKCEDNIPLLMHEAFTAKSYDFDSKNNKYYDKDGVLHEKLLDFHFCSSFTCLKEHFSLNAYKPSQSSIFISTDEAKKMLQAINYILSKKYDKAFEDILDNEYVNLFGNGFSLFDDRFKCHIDRKIYLDKTGDGYIISFGDSQWDAEIAECDDDIVFSLRRVKSCLNAFLDAETYSYDGFELILEYSAY